MHSSYIELSRSALEQNLSFLRRYLGEGVIISSVVKGNAYGHGLQDFAPLVHACGIRHFSVFSAEEAYQLRSCFEGDYTLMVMGMLTGNGMEWAIENDVEFFVFDHQRLHAASQAAKKIGKKAKVHLELETGMNRTGFRLEALNEVFHTLKSESDNLEFSGLCTHYAGAESISNYLRIKKQYKLFRQGCLQFKNAGLTPGLIHSACSAAAMTYPKTRMDMVRIGIMQYGLWPSVETFIQYVTTQEDKADPLRRVISWKTRVMSTKHVKAGEFIGYGTSFQARSDMKIAIIPVGYSNGYSRSLSNQGRVLVNGRSVEVVGIVNMNMLLADITQISETTNGDEVVLIGRQEATEMTIASFGEYSNQLNYELLTRLPERIPRKVIA